jgi:hypothetical protein
VNVANADQANNDGDALGDACDLDDDNDTVADLSDNCPILANPSQADNDLDALGDVCDSDDDNDAVTDLSDNCPLTANQDQTDSDTDLQGDVCDLDDDNDTVADLSDNCPLLANPSQADNDLDAQGDVCDLDDDNDGVADALDCAPLDATASAPPVEVGGLTLTHAGGTHLAWTGQGAGIRYDVLGGDLAAMQASGGVALATCLGNDQAGAPWSDARPDPEAGHGLYYLVRAQNVCGAATYGSASTGTPRTPEADCP